MKNRITVFTLVIIVMLFNTSCENKQKSFNVNPITDEEYLANNIVSITIPEGYVVDHTLYMAQGDGIYAFVENECFDYAAIGTEICNGNAQKIKMQFKECGNPDENLQDYAAIQNILGVSEVYLGNYEQAFEYFSSTIDFVERENFSGKDKILTVLYNNAGVVTINLPTNATDDKRLKRAAELCIEPYMSMVIAANQTDRIKVTSSSKERGEMITRANELIKKENQIEDSPHFVMFSAARSLSIGYMITEQEKKAIKILDQYIPQIPDTPEYNLAKASLLSQRGYCYYCLKKIKESIDDFQSSITLTEKTVDGNSRILAIQYGRIGVSYGSINEWETAINYIQKAILGYKTATADDIATMNFNMGFALFKLNRYEEAKRYFLIAYVNKQIVKEDLGEAVGKDYDTGVMEYLYKLHDMENDNYRFFDEWLEEELKQLKIEEVTSKQETRGEN